MAPSFALLVSSCDAYEDCWEPFFTLLADYWKPAPHPIYLNTETRDYQFDGLDIRCPRVELEAGRRLGWSDRLSKSLDAISEEIVLYMQEDYFLNDDIDAETLDGLVEIMERDGLSHIGLVPFKRPPTPSQYEFLDHIPQRNDYRISAQAGLWRIPVLQSYLRAHESVWEFEWYGSRRAWRRRDSFFYVNRHYQQVTGRSRVLPYRATGIVHGRWVRSIVEDLFAAHGVEVNYARRGFYDPEEDDWTGPPRMVRALRRLRSLA